jgi:4-oxalocrotonate tautomerase
MPFVSVKLLKGRSQDQKRDLATAITDAMEKICGAPRAGTMVVFEEYEKGDWAVAGTLVSDRDG